jgi:hypothetical protein
MQIWSHWFGKNVRCNCDYIFGSICFTIDDFQNVNDFSLLFVFKDYKECGTVKSYWFHCNFRPLSMSIHYFNLLLYNFQNMISNFYNFRNIMIFKVLF